MLLKRMYEFQPRLKLLHNSLTICRVVHGELGNGGSGRLGLINFSGVK